MNARADFQAANLAEEDLGGFLRFGTALEGSPFDFHDNVAGFEPALRLETGITAPICTAGWPSDAGNRRLLVFKPEIWRLRPGSFIGSPVFADPAGSA